MVYVAYLVPAPIGSPLLCPVNGLRKGLSTRDRPESIASRFRATVRSRPIGTGTIVPIPFLAFPGKPYLPSLASQSVARYPVLLCLFLCALPVALPVVLHLATVAIFALGFGVDVAPLTFAPYVAPVAIVAPYVAPERPSIKMPSAPCRVAVYRPEARAYPMPVLRAPRAASGRFGAVVYSASSASYESSLTVSA